MSTKLKVVLFGLLVLFAVVFVNTINSTVLYASGEATSHVSWVQGSVKSSATCTSPAVYYCNCSYCKNVDKDKKTTKSVGESLGHDFSTSPSSTDGTHHNYLCSRSGCNERGNEVSCTFNKDVKHTTGENHNYKCSECSNRGGETGCTYDDKNNPLSAGPGSHTFTCDECSHRGGKSECTFDEYNECKYVDELYHDYKCDYCTNRGGKVRHELYKEGIDEHKCWEDQHGCGWEKPNSPHHGFIGVNAGCRELLCSAVLRFASEPDFSAIEELPLKYVYMTSDSGVSWEKPKPTGTLELEFNLKPYKFKDDDSTPIDAYLRAGTFVHNSSAWHLGLSDNQDFVYSAEEEAKLIEKHKQNAEEWWEDAEYSMLEGYYWDEDQAVSAATRFEVSAQSRQEAMDNGVDVDLKRPLAAWNQFKAQIDGIDVNNNHEDMDFEFDIDAKNAKFEYSRLPGGHGHIDCIRIGTWQESFGGIRLYGKCGGSRRKLPGFLHIGYRNTNGHLILGAPHDEVKSCICYNGGNTNTPISFSCDTGLLNKLGYSYEGYMLYEKDYNSVLEFKKYEYDANGNILNATTEKIQDIWQGVGVGDVIKAQYQNNSGRYARNMGTSGSVTPTLGHRTWYVVFIFKPVQVRVSHYNVEGNSKKLINTNMNTYYYLPYTKGAQMNDYFTGTTDDGYVYHKHSSCLGIEGKTDSDILQHKNKSFDKYIYPMYVLENYVTKTARRNSSAKLYITNVCNKRSRS